MLIGRIAANRSPLNSFNLRHFQKNIQKLKFFFAGASDEMLSAEVRLPGDDQNFVRFDGVPAEIESLVNASGLDGNWFSIGGQEMSALIPWPVTSAGSSDTVGTVRTERPSGWLSPVARLPDTVIDGRPVLHYDLSVDRDGLADFLSGLSESFGLRPSLDSGSDGIRSLVDGHDVVAEGYVDRQSGDFLLLKFGVFPGDGGNSMPVAVTVKFDRFNQQVTVDRPAEAQPLSAVLLGLMSGSTVPSDERQP